MIAKRNNSKPAKITRIQVFGSSRRSESMTVYGASFEQVAEEIFRHQQSLGRAVRRRKKLFVPSSTPETSKHSDSAHQRQRQEK